ncbi:hypothetical protein D9M72_651590 [compost metagenome]
MQCFELDALCREVALDLLMRLPLFGLLFLRVCEIGLGLIAVVACVVEIGLSLAQLARLTPRQHAGIHAIALVKTFDGSRQFLEFVELPVVLLELVERFRNVGQ